MRPLRSSLLAACSAALVLATPVLAQDEAPAQPRRSVIYFIGDGMGPAQVTLGRLGARRLGRDYALDRFTSMGLASTRSLSHLVTDSAASGTALASGVKTNNQAIGLDGDSRRVETLIELAHRQGFKTGIVTTTRITHATPAAFAAHVWHRDEEREIARQLVAKAAQGYPEVLIGGGARNFTEEGLETMRRAGYELVLSPTDLDAAKGPKLAALLAKSHLPYVVDRKDDDPSLATLTRKAVSLLSRQGPFVLMVEGGRIDHAGHEHDAGTMMHEQLDFAEAVGWALDYAQDRPELLVVVTADHATGSLGITETTDVSALLRTRVSAEHLSRLGSTAEELRANLSKEQGIHLPDEVVAELARRPNDYYWARTVLGHYRSLTHGVTFYDPLYQQEELGNTHGHDGIDVPVLAEGPEAERFCGLYPNTEIVKRIAAILGLDAPGKLLDDHASSGGAGGDTRTARRGAAEGGVAGATPSAPGATPARAAFEEGRALMSRRDYSGAIAAFDRAVAVDPEHDRALYDRGTCRLKLGQLVPGILDLGRAVELEPAIADQIYEKLYQIGYVVDLARVIGELDEVVAAHPGASHVVFLRGMFRLAKTELARVGRGDIEAGIDDFDRALELNPEHVTALLYRGLLRFRLAERVAAEDRADLYARALEDYARGLELDPGSALAPYLQALLWSVRSAEAGLDGATAAERRRRACDRLRAAFDAGFDAYERVRTAGGFDPIREEPAVVELLAGEKGASVR